MKTLIELLREDDERDDPGANHVLRGYQDLAVMVRDFTHDLNQIDTESDYGETLYHDDESRAALGQLLRHANDLYRELSDLERKSQA